MNFKTTFLLVLLAAATGSLWAISAYRTPKESTSPTLAFLTGDLASGDKLDRIEVKRGEHHVVLEKSANGEWTMPGHWPTRKPEVTELVNLLTSLKSRFAPIALSGDPHDLKRYGLGVDDRVLIVQVRCGGSEHKLHFGEEPGATNRFSRPTYVRLDEQPEVVRLAPNLVAALDRPQDYYQQRRLFASERVKDPSDSEPAEQLTAQILAVSGPAGRYTLLHAATDWELSEPVRDRVDPDKLKSMLRAAPDIWAEQFVDHPQPNLATYGLDKPEETLRVTDASGNPVTLLIGNQSQVKTRTVTRPAPAPAPMGMPQEPQQEVIHDAYRYAKLQDNDQIFEVRDDKLKELFVAPETLRDPRLARFRTEDARRVEIAYGGQVIVAVKDKEKWRIEKPFAAEAEAGKVTELLDKLAFLQARDKDVIDKPALNSVGLSPPAGHVRIETEEKAASGNAPDKKTATYRFLIGKEAPDRKVYIQVEGWPRVNAVEDGCVALLKRPALAYRGHKIFDFSAADLAKIEIERGSEQFALEQAGGNWKLAAPVQTEADMIKASQLAGDLGRLEAVEFINNNASPTELEGTYGLAKPTARVTLRFTTATHPAEVLLLGKQRGDRPEYFAKLASDSAVFVVKKEIRDQVDQGSLAYRPLQIWQVAEEDLSELRLQRGAEEERLRRQGASWRIIAPFDAPAADSQLQPILGDLTSLRAERYEAHAAKDLARYGLDKPSARLVLVIGPAKKPSSEPTKGAVNERVLLLGKPSGANNKDRFAKLGDSEAVFVVGEKVAAALGHSPLELLNRSLLSLDAQAIKRIHSEAAADSLTAERDADGWHVSAKGLRFPADRETMSSVVNTWCHLRAERFAAYGTQVGLAGYGLDKPARRLTISFQSPTDKKGVVSEHHLVLGNTVSGEASARYARLDDGPGIVVLSGETVGALGQDYLGFVDRTVFNGDKAAISGFRRHAADGELEIAKNNGLWQIRKPIAAAADGPTMDSLMGDLSSLRAARIAAYPADDLQKYGLQSPSAVISLDWVDGKLPARTLKIGSVAGGSDRFAIAEGQNAVAVLPGSLVQRLLAAPLQFRDRNLAEVNDIDRAQLVRGPRSVVFQKLEGVWKMTAPIAGETEQGDLDDFVTTVAHLRADALVAEKPKELKPYGLDQPQLRWQLQSGDHVVLDLLVGKVAAEEAGKPGPRCYAKLMNHDLVFLLNQNLTNKVLGEYRNRNAWPNFDGSQVDALHYQVAGESFTLEKSDNRWHVVNRPDVTIRTEAVSETLDALSRLRADRYVADQDGDFTLYGLNPPHMTVECQTPMGKHVLLVGGVEGQSKRHYARVLETGRSDVFVLSEADAGRIVRDLEAFRARPKLPAK